MSHLDHHNFKVGAISLAVVVVTLILSVTIGANVAGISADRTGTDGLVACANTGMSATDCRVLIFGSN